MKTLISIMMVWISINTGFVVPDAPSIGYLSPFEIKRYAYGCDEKPVPIGNEDICDNILYHIEIEVFRQHKHLSIFFFDLSIFASEKIVDPLEIQLHT